MFDVNVGYVGLSSDELDERLDRWADWARAPSAGSMSAAEGYMRERVDSGADSTELTDEIAITERAIARTKIEEKAYWRVISRYYLGRLCTREIASFFCVSYESIQRLLQEAKGRIGYHIFELERQADEHNAGVDIR